MGKKDGVNIYSDLVIVPHEQVENQLKLYLFSDAIQGEGSKIFQV